MKSSVALGLLASFLTAVEAHTALVGIYVDDVKQGDGTCVRMTKDKHNPVDPIEDFMHDDVVCNNDGDIPAAFTCPASAGSKLTFEYRSNPTKSRKNYKGEGFIDPGHLGPAAIYAKQLESKDAPAAGSGWFKIWDEGYDVDSDTWAVTNLIEDQGLLSINIPKGIPAGNYIFRTEVIAMHNTTPVVTPQFYPGCAQLFIESDVTGKLDIPSEYEVSIPGYIQPGEPSMTYNIYQRDDAYPLPGPKRYVPPIPSTKGTGKVVKQTSGGVPSDCLLKNANWCGFELKSYNDDQEACWAANKACWSQVDTCWDNAPITGGKNCGVFGTKCNDIDSHCSSKDWTGPPEFKLVSEDLPPIASIPAAMNAEDVASTVDSGNGATAPAPTKTKTAAATGNGGNNDAKPTKAPQQTTTGGDDDDDNNNNNNQAQVGGTTITVTVTAGAPTATAEPEEEEEPCEHEQGRHGKMRHHHSRRTSMNKAKKTWKNFKADI